MIMEIPVVERCVDKNGEVYLKRYTRTKEVDGSRHSELCMICGFETYPECREWCTQQGYKADRG